jgi:hypothetical protein
LRQRLRLIEERSQCHLPGNTSSSCRRFTLTPRGDIDGFIFAAGGEVKTPPHLSTEIAYAIRIGDSVTVHGLKAAALPLIKAASVTDAASGTTVIDNGPAGPRRAPPPPPPPPQQP